VLPELVVVEVVVVAVHVYSVAGTSWKKQWENIFVILFDFKCFYFITPNFPNILMN
jgi:hypothetical protein